MTRREAIVTAPPAINVEGTSNDEAGKRKPQWRRASDKQADTEPKTVGSSGMALPRWRVDLLILSAWATVRRGRRPEVAYKPEPRQLGLQAR